MTVIFSSFSSSPARKILRWYTYSLTEHPNRFLNSLVRWSLLTYAMSARLRTLSSSAICCSIYAAAFSATPSLDGASFFFSAEMRSMYFCP